jgi:ABC-type branched-subunit amino acid transport system substrate-binding protein
MLAKIKEVGAQLSGFAKAHRVPLLVGFTASLLATLLWALFNWYLGKPGFQPYIAVVVSTKSIDFPIPTDFLRGFQDASSGSAGFIEDRDNRKLTIKTLEDYGSVDEARRIAQELLEEKNCILVIGNSNSTVTATTLDVFLTSRNPPSYILPIATANNLVFKARTGGYKAVLRMVPDNANQAIIIQRLTADISKSREPIVAIYGDEENPVYSQDLSRDIASRVREKGGRVVVEEMIGPSNSIFASLPVWRGKTPPEVIIYVGVAHHGLLLVDQIKEVGITVPIVFTDGCMVKSLIDNISRIPNRAFVLSPVTSSATTMPTYETIGRDAFTLASLLIKSCSDCTRERLRDVIESNKGQQIVLATGHAGEYRFNDDGNNVGMDYKVYEVTSGNLHLLNAL